MRRLRLIRSDEKYMELPINIVVIVKNSYKNYSLEPSSS
jgi:hypothetical protein